MTGLRWGAILTVCVLLGCQGPAGEQGSAGPPGAAPSAEAVAQALMAMPEFQALVSAGGSAQPGGSKVRELRSMAECLSGSRRRGLRRCGKIGLGKPVGPQGLSQPID